MLDFVICAHDLDEGRGLASILQGEAYRCEVVTDSTLAVDRLLSKGFRALIIDAGIQQGMTLNQAIPIIKKIDPNLPIIVASGNQSLEREREIRALEIFYYLVEPVEHEELVRVARDALRKHPAGM